jgi:hypothetical protein
METPLYTTFILSAEIVAELGLGTTTYLPENFNGMVYHLPQINHTYTLLSTPPAVKAILVGQLDLTAPVTLVGFVFSSYRPKTTLPVTALRK